MRAVSPRRPITVAPPWARAPSPRLLTVGAGALFAASAAALLLSPAGRHWPFVDLTIYRSAGHAVLAGQPLYELRFFEGLPFTYPPIAALALAPLSLLPDVVARIALTAVGIALLPLLLGWGLRLAPAASWVAPQRRLALALGGAAAALWLEPTLTTLRYGQVDLVIAALIVFDLSRADSSRRKGIAIGLATGLKLTPAIFVVYLLLTRRTRAAAVAVATFAATVAAGFVAMPHAAAQFWAGEFADPGRVGRIENAANQTLRGAYARLLHTVDVQPIWIPTALLIGATGILLAARAGRRGDDVAGFSLCALTGLLVSPVSWSHHWVLAVPVLGLFAVRAAQRRRGAWLAGAGAVAAIAFARVIWWVPIGLHRHAELHLADAQLVFADAYVLLALAVLALALAAASRGRPPAGAIAGQLPNAG